MTFSPAYKQDRKYRVRHILKHLRSAANWAARLKATTITAIKAALWGNLTKT
jgi:hypothetical protein